MVRLKVMVMVTVRLGEKVRIRGKVTVNFNLAYHTMLILPNT